MGCYSCQVVPQPARWVSAARPMASHAGTSGSAVECKAADSMCRANAFTEDAAVCQFAHNRQPLELRHTHTQATHRVVRFGSREAARNA